MQNENWSNGRVELVCWSSFVRTVQSVKIYHLSKNTTRSRALLTTIEARQRTWLYWHENLEKTLWSWAGLIIVSVQRGGSMKGAERFWPLKSEHFRIMFLLIFRLIATQACFLHLRSNIGGPLYIIACGVLLVALLGLACAFPKKLISQKVASSAEYVSIKEVSTST